MELILAVDERMACQREKTCRACEWSIICLTNRIGRQSGLLDDLYGEIRMISCDMSRLVNACERTSTQPVCNFPAVQTRMFLHLGWYTTSTALGLVLILLISCELT